MRQWRDRAAFLLEEIDDRDATIARLTQERDEARRSVEMLKTRYGYTEPAIEAAEARGRQQATQPSADDEERARDSWLDPTPEMLNDPLFNAIWETIKTWDINVPGVYSGYCSATGNHARKILDNIATRREERQLRALDEAAAQRLASEAETVCDLFGGDKSVDALRAALSAYLDALAARDAGLTDGEGER